MIYVRPLVQLDNSRPDDARMLAGGWGWFSQVEILSRSTAPRIVAADRAPAGVLARLTAPHAPWAGLSLDRPRIMGILNVTPDSFSDGGLHIGTDRAVAAARAMAVHADILDIGGESTRPGAAPVAEAEEIARTAPVLAAIRAAEVATPLSVDTRKAAVARAALDAGAMIINDVSGLTHDPHMMDLVAQSGAPVVIMHSRATPATMQDDPHYGDVLLDVFDALAALTARAVAAGIAPDRIAIDPGIGFAKTQEHNLALLRGLALFHGLGYPVLLGASRKRFIGAVANEPDALRRMPGSIAVALAALAQGVQILRVHDTRETAQAVALWQAATIGQVA